MMSLNRNNLDKSTSPYLNQHSDNPVFWQEWNSEILEFAKQNDKILFVSSGYSTCHWCHVMAGEAFSNREIADFINNNYIPIKIDREQRPDIDQFLMDIIVSISGSGGWPLNVFLSPDLKPITALTYAGISPRYGLPGFLDILKNVKIYYSKNKTSLQPASNIGFKPQTIKAENIIDNFYSYFDSEFGGFGKSQKFPPHCSLLFLIHYYDDEKHEYLEQIIRETLNIMSLSGLHDHLQGGFFRYCVDREWQIPHFEKMLYDQAMLIWSYSLAYKSLKNVNYKTVVEKIYDCLIETFEYNGLFYSAYDADTEHFEGKTYLWLFSELQEILTNEEFKITDDNYLISQQGNFEGKNHLIKKNFSTNIKLEDIENKLLKFRKNRKQPFLDKKIITSWNAILGIALINAYRCLSDEKYLNSALKIYENIYINHFKNNKLIHTSIENKFQEGEFLEDYAAILLLITYLQEETQNFEEDLNLFYKLIQKFKKNNVWFEANNKDFIPIEAKYFDHPIPSSVSMSEMAILRSKILLGDDYLDNEMFKNIMNFDFLNLSIFIKNGNFHIIDSQEKIDWNNLSINSIQKRGKKTIDCYKGVCKEL